MGETIEQIGDRVNPERVKADLKASARNKIHEAGDNMKRKARNTMRDVEHGVSDTGRSIWATIRENPVPAGMVGVGLAWLIANRRDAAEHHEYGTYSTGPAVPYRPGYVGGGSGAYGSAGDFGATGSYTESGAYGATGGYSPASAANVAGFREEGPAQESEGLRDKASNALHEVGDRIGDAQERVGEAVHGARERVGHAAHETQERMSSWAQQAKNSAQRAEMRVEDSLRENPVAAGAMALAIGVAAGLMIPETRREHEVMGSTRDRVLDKAQDTVRRSADRMHEAASDAAAETARHVVDEVWPGTEEGQPEGFSEPRR
jgi:ElaB/YqjD/DUF883 family membrane-anchored ribosome-binding protein